jgi:hypothetical protein
MFAYILHFSYDIVKYWSRYNPQSAKLIFGLRVACLVSLYTMYRYRIVMPWQYHKLCLTCFVSLECVVLLFLTKVASLFQTAPMKCVNYLKSGKILHQAWSIIAFGHARGHIENAIESETANPDNALESEASKPNCVGPSHFSRLAIVAWLNIFTHNIW